MVQDLETQCSLPGQSCQLLYDCVMQTLRTLLFWLHISVAHCVEDDLGRLVFFRSCSEWDVPTKLVGIRLSSPTLQGNHMLNFFASVNRYTQHTPNEKPTACQLTAQKTSWNVVVLRVQMTWMFFFLQGVYNDIWIYCIWNIWVCRIQPRAQQHVGQSKHPSIKATMWMHTGLASQMYRKPWSVVPLLRESVSTTYKCYISCPKAGSLWDDWVELHDNLWRSTCRI